MGLRVYRVYSVWVELEHLDSEALMYELEKVCAPNRLRTSQVGGGGGTLIFEGSRMFEPRL